MIDFLPITGFFSASILAGAGNVVQVTYTVPANKRAVLTHTFTRALANAGAVAAVAEVFIDVVPIATVTSNRINSLQASGLATATAQSYEAEFDLVAGDLVRILTNNGSAVNITMQCNFCVREYQQ
jgi:hypothetical protein